VKAQHVGPRAFAWGGALLFAGALAYFLFTYFVTFAEITAGTIEPQPIAIDIALFGAFALHHSIFARDRLRALVRHRVSEHLERSVYVWVASLMLIGICRAWRLVPGVLWQLQAPWSWAILVVPLAGVWLTLRSAVVIDGFELAGVRPFITPRSPAADQGRKLEVRRWEFRTDGPYGWVRHPIYLGWILVVFSVSTMTMTRFVFAVVSSLYLVIAIPLEERTLRAHSSGAYDDYMRRVPRKLIPGLY
jgi:protein-S-isoprenylcysteine O-methyltransferase Ste14